MYGMIQSKNNYVNWFHFEPLVHRKHLFDSVQSSHYDEGEVYRTTIINLT